MNGQALQLLRQATALYREAVRLREQAYAIEEQAHQLAIAETFVIALPTPADAPEPAQPQLSA